LETRPPVGGNAFGAHEPLKPVRAARCDSHELEGVRVVHVVRPCELDQERVAGRAERGPIKGSVSSIRPAKTPIKAKVQRRLFKIAVQHQILAGLRVSGRDQSFGAEVVPGLIGFAGPADFDQGVDVDGGLRRMEIFGSADDPFPDALSVCEIMVREEVSEVVELGSYALGNELLENLAAVARGFPGRVKDNLIIPGAT